MLFFIVGRRQKVDFGRLMNRKHIAKVIRFHSASAPGRKSFFLMKFYEVRISSRTSGRRGNRRLVALFSLVLIGFRSLLYGAPNE